MMETIESGYSVVSQKHEENDESAENSCKTRNFLNCDVIISDSDKQTKETR